MAKVSFKVTFDTSEITETIPGPTIQFMRVGGGRIGWVQAGTNAGSITVESIPLDNNGEHGVADNIPVESYADFKRRMRYAPFVDILNRADATRESEKSTSLCSCRMGTQSLSHAISCPCNPNYEHYMAGFPLVVTRHESLENGKALVIPDTKGDEQEADV